MAKFSDLIGKVLTSWLNPIRRIFVEFLLTLVLIGMVVYLLPYIIAAVFATIGIIGGLIALSAVTIQALFNKRS